MIFKTCLWAVLLCAAGLADAQQAAPDCVADDETCLWLAAADGHQKRKRDKGHAGEEGIIGHDGQPAPAHVCDSCHKDGADLPMPELPAGHLRTAGMSMQGCLICHEKEGKGQARSMKGRLFQSHTHFFADVACADCHADPDNPEEPETAVCLTCHGTLEELGKRTQHMEKSHHANPHASPHGAPYAQCVLCHYQHEAPDNFCATCHDFEFELP